MESRLSGRRSGGSRGPRELMQALVYHGPHDLRVEELPVPALGPGDALIRVRACGICGTDLKVARGEHRMFPEGTVRVPGHEVVGDVVRTGADVERVRAGDRVVVAPNLGCGACTACRSGRTNLCVDYEAVGLTFDGGFAEYVRVPRGALEQGNLLPVPDGDDPVPLTMVEPLAAVLRGARATATGAGDVVVVCGAGPIGLLHVIVSHARGAGRIIVSEPAPPRRRRAIALGADEAVDPRTEDLREHVLAASDGRGADVVIVAVPAPAVFQQALGLAAVGGHVNFFAGLPSRAGRVELDANLIHYRELTVTGSTANTTADCREALEALLAGDLDPAPIVSARYSLSEAPAAFADAAGGESMKVVIEA